MSEEALPGSAPSANQFLGNLRQAVTAGTAEDQQRTLLARAIKTTLVGPVISEDSQGGDALFDELRALAWDEQASEAQRTELASALS